MNSKTWIATGRNVPSHRRGAVFTLAVGAWRTVSTAWERARQRHLLVGLTDHQLRDIGLHRWDIEREMKKPFWRD